MTKCDCSGPIHVNIDGITGELVCRRCKGTVSPK